MIDFHKLQIWQRSQALVVAIHAATKSKSRGAPVGLIAQLHRASASVPANIAEGCGYDAPLQAARFLDIALGSLNETESHLLQAQLTEAIQHGLTRELINEVQQLRRMTIAYKKWLLRTK